MRQPTARRSVFLGLAITALLAASPLLAAEKASNDRLLPPQTYAYVTIPNVSELKSRFHQSLTGRLLADQKLADFLGDVRKKVTQLGDEFQQHVGLKFDDVLAVPDGEVSFAVLRPTDGKRIAIAVILDFGKSGSTVKAILDKTSAQLEKNGFKKTSRDVDGSNFTVYNQTKKDEDSKDEDSDSSKGDEPSLGRQFVYVIKNDTLIVTTSVVSAKDILRRWDGKHSETLADVPAYKAIVESGKQEGSPTVLLWYVNPIELVQTIFKSQDAVQSPVGMAMAALENMKINNLKGIGGSVHLDTNEFDSEARTLIHLEREASGLLSIFKFPPVNQLPPKWVADDSTAYISINWDIPQAYSSIETIVDNFLGPGSTAQRLEEFATQENGPKVNLKKDVLDNLDGRIQIVTDLPDTTKAESGRVLVALGVKDASKMKSVLSKVAKTPGFPGEARTFRGETIYNMEPPEQFGNTGKTWGVAVTNDNLMFATDVGRIEQVIIGDKDRKPLAESEKYRKLAKHFPSKTSVLQYQEQATQLKPLYDMLRSGKLSEAAASGPLAMTPFGTILAGIDFKKLPEFDAIRKYFPASGMYAVPRGNGAMIVSFTLKDEAK